ncbi:hypothetical protein [Parvibaculum sp.]|uniref:hypothetical protein n=1 Tax=Parvibaculum sp. TaxID=2024848 RepID=UPI003BAD299B
MKRIEQRFEPWEPARFSLIGAAFGLAYGLAMGAVVGLYTFATIDLLLWGLSLSVLLGASIAAGLAALRNRAALWLMRPREEPARKRPTGGFAAALRPRGL